VADILSGRIRSGVYNPGDLLPPERTLALDLGVNRRSVRAAINQMVGEGLVEHHPRCRPTVRMTAPLTNEERDQNREPQSKNVDSLLTSSSLIALIMWRGGGPMEQAVTAQQLIFQGMNETLMKRGYHAVFLDLGDRLGTEEENAAREAVQLRYLLNRGFGGAIFYPYAYRHNHALIDEVSRTMPFVLLDRKIPGIDTDFVGVDNYHSFAQITRHLIDLGHRRIAHVTRFEPIHTVEERAMAFMDTMHGIDLPGIAEIIVEVPPYADDRAWVAVDAIFQQPQGRRPTAAACVNDYMAVNLAKRLEYLGISIPSEVAIAGFDDIVRALHNGVALTTVAQPYEEIGNAAADLLMRRIADRSRPSQSIQLPASLVVRQSTVSS
jgi:DNA-binding LacI/PurR family transcriptional regulator